MDLIEIEFYSNALDADVFLEITTGCNIWDGWNEHGEKLSSKEIVAIEFNQHDAGIISELTEDWRNGR